MSNTSFYRGRPSASQTVVGFILALLVIVALVVFGLVLTAFVIQFAFNLLAPAIGWATIDFWPALGAAILLYLVSLSFRRNAKT